MSSSGLHGFTFDGLRVGRAYLVLSLPNSCNAKSWLLRWTKGKSTYSLGLGSIYKVAPDVVLALREKSLALVRDGVDPGRSTGRLI